MDFKKIIEESLKFEFSNNMLDSIKIGLFVGVTVSLPIGFILRITGTNIILLIIILYLYPLTGFLTGYFISKSRKDEQKIEFGYHG